MKDFSIKESSIQKYALQYVQQIPKDDYQKIDIETYIYETTVTFNQKYWSLERALSQGVYQAIADTVKPIVTVLRDSQKTTKAYVRYGVEHHKNGYPHIHFQILSEIEIPPDKQHSMHQRHCRRYGRSDWYQTGKQDKFHESSQMYWSEYIRKEGNYYMYRIRNIINEINF